MKKINLNKIIKTFPTYSIGNGEDFYHVDNVKKAMKEVCIQVLKLASENAYVDSSYQQGCCIESSDYTVNKESITSTINQIE